MLTLQTHSCRSSFLAPFFSYCTCNGINETQFMRLKKNQLPLNNAKSVTELLGTQSIKDCISLIMKKYFVFPFSPFVDVFVSIEA